MPSTSHWGTTPRRSVERECGRRGLAAVVAGCARLIEGDDSDPGLIMALGGPAAGRFLDGAPRTDDYWLRVWGLRGLLWAWDDSADAAAAVRGALADEAWRVREMAAKVAAKRSLAEAIPDLARLGADPVARVRATADRALRMP